MIKTGPKSRVYNVDEAAQRLACISRAAGGRATEPGSVTVGLQRRKRLLARVKETAAGVKARP